MKKLGLFLSLLVCSILFAGCHFKDNKIMDGDGMINEVDESMTEEEYTPVEERTKALVENPRERAYKEDVHQTERLKTLDTGFGVYPYGKFSSKTRNTLIYFESESEYGTISRYAIYDRENHKRIFDCFDGGGGGYIQVDDSININTVDIEKCIDKYNEVMNILNSVQQDGIESQQPELSEIEKLKQSFVGNIIDGKVDKESLTLQPSNISFNVEGDDTLYYLNEFGIALVLGEDWKGGKVENAYEGKNLASVWLKKSGNKTYGFFLIDNEYYHTRQENPQPDEELVGENNKYHIVMRTVKNGGKDGSFDLVVYDVE